MFYGFFGLATIVFAVFAAFAMLFGVVVATSWWSHVVCVSCGLRCLLNGITAFVCVMFDCLVPGFTLKFQENGMEWFPSVSHQVWSTRNRSRSEIGEEHHQKARPGRNHENDQAKTTKRIQNTINSTKFHRFNISKPVLSGSKLWASMQHPLAARLESPNYAQLSHLGEVSIVCLRWKESQESHHGLVTQFSTKRFCLT